MAIKYQEGAENAPVQHNLPILAIVYDLRDGDKVVVEKRFNYSNFDDRKALGKLSFWAYSNHCSIETIAVVDAEAEIMENGK